MCDYALFKRKNKRWRLLRGRDGGLDGKLLKCGIPRGRRIPLETESGEKLVHWREIVLVGTEWLQECGPLWGSANQQHTDTWAESQLCHRINAPPATAATSSLYYPQITCPHPGGKKWQLGEVEHWRLYRWQHGHRSYGWEKWAQG